MRYGSVCSGIEAATVAWHSLGWQPAFFSEIEPFPRAVLAHHYPEVPLHGDFTTIEGNEYGAIDLLVGGTPCQSFSVAGLRKGMDDNRGQLALQFLLLARRTRARWLVWENVPGVLSSNGGRDFGAFLGGLVELGYGFAYRVLDAQYFGVAQRRRRVFVVGYLGDWRRAAAVLFERHSLSGDTAPSREARKEIAGNAGAGASGYRMTAFGEYADDETASTMKARDYKDATDLAVMSVHGTQDPDCNTELAHTLGRNQGQENAVCYGIPGNWIGRAPENGGNAVEPMIDVAPCQTRTDRHGVVQVSVRDVSQTLTSNYGKQVDSSDTSLGPNVVFPSMQVRRLTPRECERLQGFPDDYTLIPWRNKPAEDCPDGPRYKALGNSMAVPCMRWIGERIQQVEQA